MKCLRDSSACAMHRGTWAWIRTDSTGKSVPHSPIFPSACKELPLIDLTSIAGQTTIRAATGISRLNLKGKSHGKPKDVGSHKTRWDLAYRQAVQRRPHSGERCNKRPHGSGSAAREAYRSDSKGVDLRGSAREDFSRGCNEVSAGEPTQEKHRR